MIDYSLISIQTVQRFSLIAVRVGTLFAISPVLGSNQVPRRAKIAVAIIVALLLYDIVPVEEGQLPAAFPLYFLFLVKEFLVGLVMGFLTMLVMSGIYLAGQAIDMQMGFGIVNVIDPITNVQIPVTGQLYFLMAFLIFLSINGHHLLITALYKSYNTIPLAGFTYSSSLVSQIMRYSADMWVVAFKIGAPSIAALFLTSVALGIIARTVPQMNIFIVGFPIKIGLGLVVVGFSLTYFQYFVREFFMDMFRDMQVLVRVMGG